MMVVFQEHGMRVTAVANTKVANFLDVTFNKVHRPYSNPGIHTGSNHPQDPKTKHAVPEISRSLSLLSRHLSLIAPSSVSFSV